MRETYGCTHNKHPPKATCLFLHSRAQHHPPMIRKKDFRVKMMIWRGVAGLHFQSGGGTLATFLGLKGSTVHFFIEFQPVTRNPSQFSLHSSCFQPFVARFCAGCRRRAIAHEPAPPDDPCAEVCGAHDARPQHPRAADDTGGESGGESGAAATHQRGGGGTCGETQGVGRFFGACWMI